MMGGTRMVAFVTWGCGGKDRGTQCVDFNGVCLGAFSGGCGHKHLGALSGRDGRGESLTCGFSNWVRGFWWNARILGGSNLPCWKGTTTYTLLGYGLVPTPSRTPVAVCCWWLCKGVRTGFTNLKKYNLLRRISANASGCVPGAWDASEDEPLCLCLSGYGGLGRASGRPRIRAGGCTACDHCFLRKWTCRCE